MLEGVVEDRDAPFHPALRVPAYAYPRRSVCYLISGISAGVGAGTGVGVGIDVLVAVAMTSVLIPLELSKPSSCAVDLLTGDWDEEFIGIDLSIDILVDEVIAVVADVWVDVMTALNFSMPPASEE